MRNTAAMGLISLVLFGCGSPKVTPGFRGNAAVYQDAVHAVIGSEEFRQCRERQERLEISRLRADSIAYPAALKVLFELEPIEQISVEADSSLCFSFPARETTLGLGSEGSRLIYLPNSKYWHLPNDKIINSTLVKTKDLGEGWFQSDWINNIAY